MIFDGVIIENMAWANEWDYEPVRQEVHRSVTGALVVFERAEPAGEKMQLSGGWVTRAQLRDINAKRAAAAQNYELVLDDGRGFWVMFDRSQQSVVATPVDGPYTVPEDSDRYALVLNLLIVSKK